MPVSYEIQTLASGMISNQERQDVISNNLANVSTNGYKKDMAVQRSFNAIFETAQNPRKSRSLHDSIYYSSSAYDIPVFTQEVKTNFEQGSAILTNNTFDCALFSKGFFTIETEDGIRYTRNGSFMLNSNNELVNAHGCRVIAEGGEDGSGAPLVINGENVTFLNDGTVQADGIAVGKLRILDFDNYDVLKKTEKSLYDYQGDQSGIHVADAPNVEQGYLENSNVNAISEMTGILRNTKEYELAGRSFKAIEQTLSRAVTELGKFK